MVLQRAHVEEMFAHARAAAPAECCGVIGGRAQTAESVYRLRNIARDPLTAYEAAPEDLFAAQRRIRERGEELLAIYHSHPRSLDPVPSQTDVRLAFYPSAVYFIIGLAGEAESVLRAFRLFERESTWERVELQIIEDKE